MKKILSLLSTLLLCVTFSLKAQLLVEDFNYTAGTPLTANGWIAHSAAGTNPMTVGANSLTFPTYAPMGIGGSGVSIGNSEDVNKDFPTVTSGSVYASFLLRLDTIGGSGYFFHLMDTAAGTSLFRARTYFQADANNPLAYNFGFTFNSSTGTYDTTEFLLGSTVLVVVKYTIVPGTLNDEVSLYVFDGSTSFATEPTTPLMGPFTGTAADIDPGKIALRQFNAGTDLTVDAFKVDTAWNLAPATLAQIDLPITWDMPNVDYTTTPFGSNMSQLAPDPTNASNTVLEVIKPNGAATWAGVTLSTTAGLASTIPFNTNANTISAKVYSPSAGMVIKLKAEVVGTTTGQTVETDQTTTVANGWETLVFNFTNNSPSTPAINYANNYGLLAMFFDFGVGGANDTFYVDSVYFGGGSATQTSSVPAYPIATVRTVDANFSPDSLGVNCKLTGTVVGIDLDGNAGYSFTIVDATSGINVFSVPDVDNYVVTEGDIIDVYGTIAFFNGLTEIIPDSIHLVSQNNPIPTPAVVTALGEATESQLVKLSNVVIVPGATWPAAGSNGNVNVTDGTNTFTLRIDSDTDIDGGIVPAPNDTFCVVGIGGQFDNSSPYDGGYQLFPQRLADIDTSCGTPIVVNPPAPFVYPMYPIGLVRTTDADVYPDSIGVKCGLAGVVVGVDLDGNAGYSFTLCDMMSGINIFNPADKNGYTNPTEGDSILAFGTIDFYNGLTELIVDSVVFLNAGNPIPPHATVTMLDETTESRPIKVEYYYVADPALWPAPGANANVPITNGTDTLIMRIDKDTDIDDIITTCPTDTFCVMGVGGQFDGTAPYDGGYQIFPMRATDFTFGCVPPLFAPSIQLNEIVVKNIDIVADDQGEFDSWIEIKNLDSNPVDLASLFIGDGTTMYQIPGGSNAATSISANGYTLAWADAGQSVDGPMHLSFTLNPAGGFVAIYANDGTTLIDSTSYPAMLDNEAWARHEDGAMWMIHGTATPYAINMMDNVNEVSGQRSAFFAYPNPTAAGMITFNKAVSGNVMNLLGQSVATFRNATTLDLSGFTPGVYIIRNSSNETTRVIVK